MTNPQAVVDQIVQNLAFEVEAVPKNKSIQDTSISQSTSLNVKIKVRKKDEILKQHDVSSIADDARRAVQKIRLVNSDRTIMNFDVFMEAEFEKKPSRNLRKYIFDMLRPGICLGPVDDDEYPYIPSSSYSANITEPSVANKSDGTLLKQTFTLSKNVYQTYTASTQPGGQKWLFGKCKPGGCLDPPFSEDKYSYKPSISAEPEREGEEILEEEDVGSHIYSKNIPIPLHDGEIQNNGRHSSIFDSGLYKKKRKCSDNSTNTKLPDKTDSIVDIYQGESAKNSVSTTYSNSIITYPPKLRSDPRISDDKTVRSRGSSEDKSRKSFNEHSEPYFIRPKGVIRIKEKKTLDSSDYPKHRSSDATDLRNSQESFKMPLPLPIPVPIPIMSNKRKSEVIATNDNILKTQSDSATVTELDAIPDQKPQDQESQDAINLKDTDMAPRLLRDTSATGENDDKLMVSSKIATLIPSNIEQPITLDEIDDQNLHEILQPLKEIDSENNIEVTAQPSKKAKTEPLKGPVPVPFIFSEANLAAVLDSKIINDNLQRSEMKLTESNQSFETKTTPPTITDTPFEDYKEMQHNIDLGNRSGKIASTATATPKSQFSDIEAYAILENYLRTRGGFSDQESDTETPVTIAPTIDEVTKRDSKTEKITQEPAKQNDIKDKDSTTTVTTIAAAAAAAAIEESLEIYDMPDTDTQQIKGSPQISLFKLPILKRSLSILSGIKTSTASVKDKTKRSDRLDKHFDNVGYRDTDKIISILSQGKTSAASVTDKTKKCNIPDKHLDNVGHRDTDFRAHIDEERTSLSSGPTSTASVKDKTKSSDSPDKHLDNAGHRDTDLGIHKDEKRSSLSSGPTSAKSVKNKTNRSDSPEKHLDKVGDRDTAKSISILSQGKTSAASVTDKTKRSDSPDKHLDNVGYRDTDKSISILSQGKTSAASVTDKTKRCNSPDKHLNSAEHRDTDFGVHINEERRSLSSGPTSTASVKDKTKTSDSPDKHLDNVGHRDTDLGIHKDEKRSSLSSGPTSAASVTDKTKRSNSPDKHLDNVGHRDTDFSVHIDEERTSLSSRPTSTASVKDTTKRSDSPDKDLDNVGHRDTDLGIHKDEKQSSLSSGSTSAESGKNKTKRSDSPDKHLDNVGHRDTDKSISILSQGKTSAASVTDKTKRRNSPDKHLDNVGHRETDFSVHIDEERTSLSSRPTSTASVKDTTKRSDSPDKDLDNVGHRDTDLGIHKDEKRSSLSSGLTSAKSVKNKTNRSDSPDKHLDKVGDRDTAKSISILSQGKTSAASVTNKTKKCNSPDKHLDNVGHRDTDFGVHIDKKRTSLPSGPTSAKSVKNKTNRSDSPDKHLDNVGHRDTDFDVLMDEKRTSLASGPKHETDIRDAKISEPPSDKEYLSDTEKPNNDDNINSYTESQARFTGEGNLNFKVAPIIIDNTEPTPNFEPLEKVYSETNFLGEPMNTGHDFNPSGVSFTTQIASRLKKFDEDDDTHSTVSRELIGTKSVIYDTDKYIPATSEKKNAERIPSYDKRVILPVDIVIPSIQSTSTLKSAMKTDTMSVELGFHSYLNDKNERMLRTFDTANAPKRLQNDSVTVLKSQIRISSNEIRIPVDSEHDMSIQIKKSNANQRVSIRESGFVNVIDNGRVKKQGSPVQYSDAEMRSSEAKEEVRKNNKLESDARDDHFIDYYEQELVPLQLIIKNLRDEIDVLAAQQLVFKDKLFCANKSTIPRLVLSNKKCFGCVRK